MTDRIAEIRAHIEAGRAISPSETRTLLAALDAAQARVAELEADIARLEPIRDATRQYAIGWRDGRYAARLAHDAVVAQIRARLDGLLAPGMETLQDNAIDGIADMLTGGE